MKGLRLRRMGDIGKYFNRKEFSCHCGCGFDKIDPELVSILDEIRDKIGQPLKIVSGCRCEAWNKKVGGEDNSAHMRGKAADVAVTGSSFRFVMTRIAYALGIKRMGQYRTWIHIDIDKENPQYVMWFK